MFRRGRGRGEGGRKGQRRVAGRGEGVAVVAMLAGVPVVVDGLREEGGAEEEEEGGRGLKEGWEVAVSSRFLPSQLRRVHARRTTWSGQKGVLP